MQIHYEVGGWALEIETFSEKGVEGVGTKVYRTYPIRTTILNYTYVSLYKYIQTYVLIYISLNVYFLSQKLN